MLLGCRISEEEHSAYLASLLEETEDPEETEEEIVENEENGDVNSHYVRFDNDESCITFDEQNDSIPFSQGAWTLSFMIPEVIPDESTNLSLFSRGDTTLSISHNLEDITLMICDNTMSLDSCQQQEGTPNRSIQVGERITIFYAASQRKLVLLKNLNEILSMSNVDTVFPSTGELRFGCHNSEWQGPWIGGLDSMILWGQAVSPSMIGELLNSEDAGKLPEFLDSMEDANFSFWSLGEDEYPMVQDLTQELNGSAESIVFVER
jgi:hypothetical protein